MISAALDIPSVKDKVSPEEWQVRVDLAACYRLSPPTGGTISSSPTSRHGAGAERHFLINPYGLFDEITASSLVKIDLDGNAVMDSPYPVNAAGFVIHSAIHQGRADAKCVLHLHTSPASRWPPSAPDCYRSPSTRSSC